MITTTRIGFADLSRQKRYRTDLAGALSPQNTVRQAVDHYLTAMRIPSNGLRWTAFSRGVRLDMKRSLQELPEADTAWTVIPEVTAG